MPRDFVRFRSGHGDAGFGIVDLEGCVRECKGDLFGEFVETGRTFSLETLKLLPATAATKMIVAWHNSKKLLSDFGKARPSEFLYTMKPPSAFAAHLDEIVLPRGNEGRIILEGELGVVIGSVCRAVPVKEAERHIFGYTIVNDVTAIDVIREDKHFDQFIRAKGFDTFGPIGPHVRTGITADEVREFRLRSHLNGTLCQSYPISDLAFDPLEMVSLVSRTMTLVPGDILSCGTSNELTCLSDGDRVDIKIDGIGTLTNHVRRA